MRGSQEELDSLNSALEILTTIRNNFEIDGPPPPPPPPPDAFPASGTWDEKIAWIHTQAGVKTPTSELMTVGGGSVPAGCRWDGKNLLVDTAEVLEDLLVPGTIVTTDRSASPVILRNVMAQDIFTWYVGFRRVSLIEDCDFFIPPDRVRGGWGQGAINVPAPGCIIKRTKMRGSSDGAQISGGATFEDCVISDLTISNTVQLVSHNDFIQNYGGTVTVNRCHFVQPSTPDMNNHVNGVFCDGGDYLITNSAIEVFKDPGVNAWTLHAVKTGFIDVNNSLVRGALVGDVRIGANVVRL